MARRANSVEGFYAGDISSRACGKSNSASALNVWTRTLRPSSRREKLELFLITLYVPSVASIKNRGDAVWLFTTLVFIREDERIRVYRHGGEVRLESAEQIWYNTRKPQGIYS